jgi:hypothetical protein
MDMMGIGTRSTTTRVRPHARREALLVGECAWPAAQAAVAASAVRAAMAHAALRVRVHVQRSLRSGWETSGRRENSWRAPLYALRRSEGLPRPAGAQWSVEPRCSSDAAPRTGRGLSCWGSLGLCGVRDECCGARDECCGARGADYRSVGVIRTSPTPTPHPRQGIIISRGVHVPWDPPYPRWPGLKLGRNAGSRRDRLVGGDEACCSRMGNRCRTGCGKWAGGSQDGLCRSCKRDGRTPSPTKSTSPTPLSTPRVSGAPALLYIAACKGDEKGVTAILASRSDINEKVEHAGSECNGATALIGCVGQP